ncbi:MAG: prephenate dehydratase [Candidatus Omnitrophica bacterium]|nr:prephenate dehydratase [Candidatus Omnitrophota bacterium]
MMELKELRGKIDEIDSILLKKLNDRAKLSLEIGKIKSCGKKEIYAPAREKEVYLNLIKKNTGPMTEKSLCAIYREIMSASIALEKTVRVAYLGPPASFTHLASLSKFGSSVEYLSCDNIPDVFREVEKSRADYGVVPIENSTEGAVTYTLDMFVDANLKICSEIMFEINHNLISNSPKNMIKKVYSNPQVFSQCRLWIEKNIPRAVLVDMTSTTKAAQKAKRSKYSAAIASRLAAEMYGLKITAASIEDSPHNVTRFLVIGKNDVSYTGSDKTSIMFSVKDRVGALYNMLAPFKKNKINLTKIESRPSKKKAWKYYFFVDIEGHYDDKKVKTALKELAAHCHYVKILGSYPKSN